MTEPEVSDLELIELDGYRISYADIIKACSGENYDMSLVSREAEVVFKAVNTNPIDSRLEACYVPARGDFYSAVQHPTGELLQGVPVTRFGRLQCDVSPESLCVLLRRLLEMTYCEGCQCDPDGCDGAVGYDLATTILLTLGFNEYGQFVGRENL